MRVAYFQCANGASGDMALGALVDAGVPLERLQKALSTLGPSMPRLEAETVRRAGLRATLVQVRHGAEDKPRSLRQLLETVEHAPLPERVRRDALQVIRRLGEAEARIHGLSFDAVELEELGSVDTLADVVGTVVGLAELDVEQVYASALPVGAGRVRSHHGLLPVPVPGVLELVRDARAPVMPPSPEDITGELVTPTGAAILTTLASFQHAPPLTLERIGYGAGSRDPADRPNVLALWVGETSQQAGAREMVLVETTIDDMNPEIYGHLREVLMTEGARDVWLTPVQMKKNRPGTMVTAIAPASAEGRLVQILLRETSTLGVRVLPVRRHEVAREIVEMVMPLGMVHVKLKHLEGRIVEASPEYEDCRRIAQERGLPLQEVYRQAQRAAEDRFLGKE